jgi:dCTP deaminase
MTTPQPGCFPRQWIRKAIEQQHVMAANPFEGPQLQPNSLDLRLGAHAHRIQCSFLPGREGMAAKLERMSWYRIELDDEGYVMEPGQIYILPLQETLRLPAGISARANPKSSTGRLDVFTRVVTEHGMAFDQISEGYAGPLYLEVAPRSFAIRVRPGDKLAQMRFLSGATSLSDADIGRTLDTEGMLFDEHGTAIRAAGAAIASGLLLSAQLNSSSSGAAVAYRARKNTPPIDLRSRGLPIEPYWEAISARGPLILEPDEFYVLASKELLAIPPGLCAEMVPFDPGSGELRTHYAGFFDSGFGGGAARSPAAAVLEIRSRDVPFLIEDGHPLFRLLFLRNTEPPDLLYGQDDASSSYQSQRLRLAKQFEG